MEDLFICVGDVAIQTAHKCCLCWFREEIDSNMATKVSAIISDLQQKVDLTAPEFLDVNLQFLKTVRSDTYCTRYAFLVSGFVKYLLGGTKLDVLYRELIFLVSIVTINKRQLSEEDVKSVLPDIKLTILLEGVLKCMLD